MPAVPASGERPKAPEPNAGESEKGDEKGDGGDAKLPLGDEALAALRSSAVRAASSN